MNWFKKTFYIFSMVAIATLASGCSSRNTSTEVANSTFVIWAFDDEDVWKPIIKQMQKELKNYDIKYVKKALSDSYENDALNSILSGQGPDIWAIPNDWVYRHKDKLAAMPDELVETTKLNIEDQFVPVIKDSVYFDDKVYALSPTVDTLMVYYNEKVFEAANDEFRTAHKILSTDNEAVQESKKAEMSKASKLLGSVPATWTDFVECSKLITKKEGANIIRSGVAMGTADNVSYPLDMLYALMLQNGTGMVSTDMKLATFNLPQDTTSGKDDYPARRALDFYTSFSDPSSANYSWNSSAGNDIEAFAQGKVGMILGPQSLGQKLSQKYADFRYKTAPLPQIGTSDSDVVDYANFTAFVAPAISQHSDAAWNVIYNLSTGTYSYDSTVRVSTSAKKKDYTASIKEREGQNNPGNFQSQTAKTWVKGRYASSSDNLMGSAIREVSDKRLLSQAALDSTAFKITEMLKKETW